MKIQEPQPIVQKTSHNKFVFTPYTDILLLWAKYTYPSSQWSDIKVHIHQKYKINVPVQALQQRYIDFLQDEEIKCKYEHFNSNSNMFDDFEEKKPQDFIDIYKQIKQEKQRKARQKRSILKQKQIIFGCLFNPKYKFIDARKRIKRYQNHSNQESFENQIHQLHSIVKQYLNICLDTDKHLYESLQYIFTSITEAINQIIQQHNINPKYYITRINQILEIIRKWNIYRKIGQIIIYYHSQNIKMSKKIKTIGRWVDAIMQKQTDNIDIQQFCSRENQINEFQIKQENDSISNENMIKQNQTSNKNQQFSFNCKIEEVTNRQIHIKYQEEDRQKFNSNLSTFKQQYFKIYINPLKQQEVKKVNQLKNEEQSLQMLSHILQKDCSSEVKDSSQMYLSNQQQSFKIEEISLNRTLY